MAPASRRSWHRLWAQRLQKRGKWPSGRMGTTSDVLVIKWCLLIQQSDGSQNLHQTHCYSSHQLVAQAFQRSARRFWKLVNAWIDQYPACQIDGCDGCWGICGKLGGTPDMLKRAWTYLWAFAPFSEVEESAKVLQYLESEWLCVPWMSDILLQTSTSASAWDILPDTRAHQILSNVSQRIQWPWVQCLKMPGKKFVCPWVWKRSLADLGSLNMKTQLSCGPLQWNQSVSMYSRVLTVFTISQFKADQ